MSEDLSSFDATPVPYPMNPPTDANEAFDAWLAQRGVKGDPLLETITNLAFEAGWGARGERVTPEPALQNFQKVVDAAEAQVRETCAAWEAWDDDTRRVGGPLVDLLADNLNIALWATRAGSPVPADPEEPR